MSKSSIEWTEDTWNPIVGCSILSPGCTNCYAMKMAARIEAMNAEVKAGHGNAPQYTGTTKKVNGNAVWTGLLAMAGDNILLQPLKRKKPTTYFVNSMGDLFHEDCPDGWIDRVFAVMALSPQHTFQVLTKRAGRMRDYFCRDERWRNRQIVVARNGIAGVKIDFGPMPTVLPLPNVWLGISTERQQEADERIPDLLNTPAAVRFISAEPLLGPIDLTQIKLQGIVDPLDAFDGRTWCRPHSLGGKKFYSGLSNGRGKLDWVIVGGESGPGSRPMHPDWARSLRDQCSAAGVPFFFKQWGAFRPLTEVEKVTACGATLVYRETEIQRGSQNGAYMLQVAKKAAGRSLDGIEYNEMPDLVRQLSDRRRPEAE